MGRPRVVGSANTRPQTKGREPLGIGTPIGKSSKTRVIPAPPIKKRTFTHCESKNKKGQPCGAPNVTGKPYCQGHLNALAAKARSESAPA